MNSPVANSSARAAVMTRFVAIQLPAPRSPTDTLFRLFADLVTDSLTEFAYDADLAGLSYNFSHQSLGLYVALSGYNDKLHLLLRTVLERAKSLQVNPDRLAVMKDQVRWSRRTLSNDSLFATLFFHRLSGSMRTTPSALPSASRATIADICSLSGSGLRMNYWQRYHVRASSMVSQMLQYTGQCYPVVTPEEVQQHVAALLLKLHIRMTVIGNVYKDVRSLITLYRVALSNQIPQEAARLAEMAEEILQAESIPADELYDLSLVLPPGSYLRPCI